MASAATPSRTPKPEPDWDLVYKRNPVERIKRDKSPLGILHELPALIAAGYDLERHACLGEQAPPPHRVRK